MIFSVGTTFFKSPPKPAGRFQSLGQDRFHALDTKTGRLCSTLDVLSTPYKNFKDVQATGVEGSGIFAVPDSWDDKRTQAYLDTYRAEDPEGFLRPGRKAYDPLFDHSGIGLPACSSLE